MGFADFRNDRTVFVANIPQETQHWQLKELMRQFGAIESAFLSKKNAKQAFRYGFVCYTDRTSTTIALRSTEPLLLLGMPITVRRRTNVAMDAAPMHAAAHAGAKRMQSPSRASNKAKFQANIEHNSPSSLAFQSATRYAMTMESSVAACTETQELATVRQARNLQWEVRNDNGAAGMQQTGSPGPKEVGATAESKPGRHSVQALAYGTNGILKIGPGIQPKATSNGARVVRVAGVPGDWRAADLYKHLRDVGIAVTATLVYDDTDEQNTRQGIIQLTSPREAAALVRTDTLKTPRLRLKIALSTVESVGRVRRSYYGMFTAFSIEEDSISDDVVVPPTVATKETYGYSVAEPREPRYMATQSPLWSSGSNMSSPSGPTTPESGVVDSPNTPDSVQSGVMHKRATTTMLEETEYEQVHLDKDARKAPQECKPNEKHPSLKHTDSKYMQHDWHALLRPQSAAGRPVSRLGNQAAFAGVNSMFQGSPFRVGAFPHKPSQTLIVENIDGRLTRNSMNLLAIFQQYGEVINIDTVPLSTYQTRAYISYAYPMHAETALYQIQASSTGAAPLCAYLA